MEITALYKIYLQHPSVQIDTRKLQAGDIFFALKGTNFNGNLFATQAISQGAAYAIVDEEIQTTTPRIIRVANTLHTLQNLAKHHRQQLQIPLLAITGSNGKTTTKELLHAVLATRYRTSCTVGNLNNHIGVPLTLLQIKKDTEIAIIEMGANHLHEIASYCSYAIPTHCLITNCGKAHLEGFGSEAGVRKAKGELFDYIRNNDGTAFVYADYEYFLPMIHGIQNIVYYGTNKGIVTANAVANSSFLSLHITNGYDFETLDTHLIGSYNLPNVVATLAVAKYFGVDEQRCKTAIENYLPTNNRSQLIAKDGNKIILDAYNANPSSMRAAIENFAAWQTPQLKILILGEMMELGKDSAMEHEHLVQFIKQYKWYKVVLVGDNFSKIKHPFDCFHTSAEAKEWLNKQFFFNVHILIKGSRSMAMEKIVQ